MSEKNMITDKLLITKRNYPTLFKALEKISDDAGNQAGHTNYAIDMDWKEDLSEVESYLSGLTEEQLDTISIGEDTEREGLVLEGGKYAISADHILQQAFESM